MNATLKTKIAKINDTIIKVQAQADALMGEIVILKAKREELQSNLDSIFDPATVVTGDTVVFTCGRGETAAHALGLVIGAKDGKFRIALGQGFEATVMTVKADKIVRKEKAA